jgi:hypothetical protein
MKKLFLFCSIFVSFSPTSFSASCEEKWQSEGILAEQCANLSVITLTGDPVARARRYGEYLRQHEKTQVIDYFSDKVFRSVEVPEIFQPLLHWSYNQWIRVWHRNTPPALGEELNAFAQGLQVDPILLKRAISLPDTASAVMGKENQQMIPTLGCTSVAAENTDGKFFYGRNLDFAGVNLWDQHPTILKIVPQDEKEWKHLVLGADGLLFGGITGVNEKGITVAVHQNYTSDIGVSGIPMLYLGELVLRSAENLDQAIEILDRHRPSVRWTLVVTDLTLGQAVAVETSPNHFFVRWGQPEGFVQTNHLLGNREAEAISLGTKLNSLQRMKTAFELLLKNTDRLQTESIAEILSFQQNPLGYFSAYADILKAHTIQTVIFSPEIESLGQMHLSSSEAPTAGGKYFRFSLDDLFGANPTSYQVVDLVKIPVEKRARQIEISQAFQAYFDQKNFDRAIAILRSHDTLASLLFQTSALFQLGRWEEAVALAERANRDSKFLGEPLYIRQSVRWLQLLSLYSLDRKVEARKLAEDLAEEQPINPRLNELVKRLKAGKGPKPRDFSLAFEFFSGDLGTRPQ